MDLVARAEHERDGPLAAELDQPIEPFGIAVELGVVSPAELVPAIGRVPEPLAELGARRELSEPFVDRGIFLAQAARPQAIEQAALREAADWWAGLSTDSHGEEEFIRKIAPSMRSRLSREAVATMDLPAFTEALRNVNAYRMHARQVKNTEFGLPKDHHESIDQRVDRLCAWLWAQRTASGHDVREVLEFVLWGNSPSDMEERLWLGVWSDDYSLDHFGRSSLGEAVGWARPDDYPPRNNRTNKALRALGHDVKLFSS